MNSEQLMSGKKERTVRLLLLSFAGLLLNIAGSQAVRLLNLPLYLDNIGSALAAALGGYIPGIIVGFFTNLVNGFFDYSSVYYGVLTVLIAISSAWYGEHKAYEKWYKLPLIILTFALIGGGLGSLLTWLLYGFSFGGTISESLARQIYAGGVLNMFWSQFSADMLIDLLDKTITVLFVALTLRLLSARLKTQLRFTGWRQKPVSLRALRQAGKLDRRKSLRLKIVLIVGLSTIITGIAVTTISYIHFTEAAKDEQTTLAKGVADVIIGSVEGDRVDEFLEKGDAAEGYKETETILKSLMDSSEYIEFCYVYRILPDGCHVVFDPDTEEVPGADPGEVVEFDHAFLDDIPDLLAGKAVGPKSSDETYGWLLTIFEPIVDSNGVCQAHVGVDINLAHIAVAGYQFLARVISLFLAFLIMILTVVIWVAEYNVILPINSMALQANRADYSSAESRADSVRSIEQLGIRTGDEIENLYSAMVKSTRQMSDAAEEMARILVQTQQQNEIIDKMQNGLIMVLADLVESRDQNTGEHVRKTAAYTGVIMRQLRAEHIYEDQLTNDFIADVMRSAPLHDIGKIHVPDAILNKPGKLTDEEFAQMKTHTTAGAEIIESAMTMVSEGDSGYLAEAQKLAHFHHEKWNGSGYPLGLKGEDIPLSARVMAVADVFDALVSKRSYKDGFPFEKAMAIIQEGSGSHFDPNVAKAFIDAGDEVRQIMESYMGR